MIQPSPSASLLRTPHFWIAASLVLAALAISGAEVLKVIGCQSPTNNT